MNKFYLTFLLVILSLGSIYAQAPQRMSYQAVVRDANNVLVSNQTIGMQISILQGSSTGTIVYEETHSPISNSNGLVSIEIGGGVALLGSFSGIDWANGPYFVQTEMDPTGGSNFTISGISQLLSVPFALHANTVENIIENDTTLWKKTNDDIYYLNGNVGLGTKNPGILNFSSPTQVLTMNKENGTAAIELAGERLNDGQSIGWFTYFNGDNRIVDVYVSRENNGTSGAFTIRTNNGAGGTSPASMEKQFTITDEGDVYLNDSSNGVIMKSPNQQCWKLTVDNAGNLVSTQVSCP